MAATLTQLETALRNAHNAGDGNAARKLAAVVKRERERQRTDPDLEYALEEEEQVAPETVIPTPAGGASFGEAITGAGEAALTLGTAATGGMVGNIAGAAEGIVRGIAAGNFGSAEAADRIERLAMERAKQLTYEPRTESGRGQVKAVGEALAPLEAIPPLAQAQSLAGASRFASPQVGAAGRQAKAAIAPAAQKVAQEITSRVGARMPQAPKGRSVGAAQSPADLQRTTTASVMPIPFEGESALTKGQATRNFEQLQFEKETAKLGEVGAPLRGRVENQTSTLIANLDAVSDLSNPTRFEVRDIGRAVDDALAKRHKGMKKREKSLYDKAEKAGAMDDRVELKGMDSLFSALDEMEDVASNAAAIKKIAIKRGIVSESEGGVIAQPKSLSEIERFRQFVNAATDITDPRESRVRAIVLSAIDESTEGMGGDSYKAARNFSSRMRQEFQNVGLTKKLLNNKRGTSERQVSYEDVFKKIMLDSPIDEINKLRGTLLKSGDDGKQAWADLKAKGIEHIKSSAQSPSQRSESGAPLLSPDKLNKAINKMDEGGKLESIYGKKSAQVLRDLGDLASVIHTAPPGAVNYSNTASALQVALDGLGTFAVTGVPIPVISALRSGAKAVQDKKKRRQIEESLNYLKEK